MRLKLVKKYKNKLRKFWGYRSPDERARPVGVKLPTHFLKSYFTRDDFLEIGFCVIYQGIQHIFGPSTRIILSGTLGWELQKQKIKVTIKTTKAIFCDVIGCSMGLYNFMLLKSSI